MNEADQDHGLEYLAILHLSRVVITPGVLNIVLRTKHDIAAPDAERHLNDNEPEFKEFRATEISFFEEF